MQNIKIELLQQNDEEKWQQFVDNCPNSSVFNRLEWRDILEQTYKFEPIFLIAKKNGNIINGLPLFLVKLPLFGKKIISIPHDGCFGGVINENQNDISVRLLYQKAINISIEKNVNYLEIRKIKQSETLKSLDFAEERPMYISVVELKNIKENWKQLSKGHKWSVRYAERFGLKVVKSDKTNDLKLFYHIMSKTFRGFGTPIYHFKFIKAIQDTLDKDKMVLLMIKKGDLVIGGGLFLVGKKTMLYKWGACDNNYLKYKPYNLMLWKAFELSIERNKSEFNLGITEPSKKGLLAFKNHWGAKSEKLYFYYFSVKTGYPDISKYFSSFNWIRSIWRKVPLPLTPLVGRYIHAWFC